MELPLNKPYLCGFIGIFSSTPNLLCASGRSAAICFASVSVEALPHQEVPEPLFRLVQFKDGQERDGIPLLRISLTATLRMSISPFCLSLCLSLRSEVRDPCTLHNEIDDAQKALPKNKSLYSTD